MVLDLTIFLVNLYSLLHLLQAFQSLLMRTNPRACLLVVDMLFVVMCSSWFSLMKNKFTFRFRP